MDCNENNDDDDGTSNSNDEDNRELNHRTLKVNK